MIRCTRCVLPETYPGVDFDENGICIFCRKTPNVGGSNVRQLEALFASARKKSRKYDALVPLSGGKDSVYILYLAKKVYGLNVLTYTFDNGFLSERARENIQNAVGAVGVENVLIEPDWKILKKLYRASLINSGELCSVCGLGITMNFYKISSDFRIPLILRGKSLIEENSYSPEKIYDLKRFRKIMSDAVDVTPEDVGSLLLYPNLNLLSRVLCTVSGKIGRLASPLYYLERKTELEIKKIIQKEMNWRDHSDSILSKHFDCTASPFSNFLRERRFGYSRKVCQLSNMIRLGDITREQAIEVLHAENLSKEPANTDLILQKLELTRTEWQKIVKIEPGKYERYTYLSDRVIRLAKSVALTCFGMIKKVVARKDQC